jgi:hypothetical protein
MKTALLILIFVAAGSPVLAKPYHAHQNSGQAARSESSHINCATVRAYVGPVGYGAGQGAGSGCRDDCVARTEGKAVLCGEGLTSIVFLHGVDGVME